MRSVFPLLLLVSLAFLVSNSTAYDDHVEVPTLDCSDEVNADNKISVRQAHGNFQKNFKKIREAIRNRINANGVHNSEASYEGIFGLVAGLAQNVWKLLNVVPT